MHYLKLSAILLLYLLARRPRGKIYIHVSVLTG